MKFINFDQIFGNGLSDPVGYEYQKYLLRKYFDDFFKSFNESNNKISNGILLYGGSGNGKTSMVFALAKETETPLISLIINDLFVSSIRLTDNINNMFAYLESSSRCILVIDEIDSIFKNREKCNFTQNQEKILAMFLQKVDGAGGSRSKKKKCLNYRNK